MSDKIRRYGEDRNQSDNSSYLYAPDNEHMDCFSVTDPDLFPEQDNNMMVWPII